MTPPLVKICGLMRAEQAAAVARLGADAIGVIAVPRSPRWVPPGQRAALFAAAAEASPHCAGVLVVADPQDGDLAELDAGAGHQVLQLHGQESVERCAALRRRLDVSLWKALRIRSPRDLERAWDYAGAVDGLLLDAWVADQLGGSGRAIPLDWLAGFAPPLPWWLAGGLTPERLDSVLAAVRPPGLDLSSGVENAPGDKDLQRVALLFERLAALTDGGAGGGGAAGR